MPGYKTLHDRPKYKTMRSQGKTFHVGALTTPPPGLWSEDMSKHTEVKLCRVTAVDP